MNSTKAASATPAPIVPEIGMGVTYLCGSDRYPYTIIKVNTPHKLTIREDNPISKRVARDPKPKAIRLHKSGHWFDKDGMQYRIGDRESYLDPNF